MDPVNLLIITGALGAGAFAKGVTGMGLPLISIPILTSFLGLPHALCVLVIPILVTNAWQAWCFRAEYSASRMPFLWPMIAASVMGMIVGTFALATVSERVLVVTLAVTIFGYIVLRIVRPNFVLTLVAAKRAAAPVGLFAGIFQGATGVSAPIAATFVHAMRLHYGSHVLALSVIFLASTATQVVTLSMAGILTWRWLFEGIFALIPVASLMPLGQHLGTRVVPTTFDRIILVFLAVIGVFLLLE